MRRYRRTCSCLLVVLAVLVAAATASEASALTTNIYQESSSKLVYSGTWKLARTSKCMGGAMRTRNATGSVKAVFTGTAVSVFVTKGRAYGIMKVTLDGVARRVSLYRSSTAYRQKVFSRTGLTAGPHTIMLQWTGTKSAAATSKTVNLDALAIRGALNQTGGLVGFWAAPVEPTYADAYRFYANGTYKRVIVYDLGSSGDGTFVHTGQYTTYYDPAYSSLILGLFFRTEKYTPEVGGGETQQLGDIGYLYYINGTTLGIKDYASWYTYYYKQ
jgi:hypothetical protein